MLTCIDVKFIFNTVRLEESRRATVSTANSPYSEHIRSVHILITSGRGELWFSCLTQSVTVRTAKI